jgi:hypothetical protein
VVAINLMSASSGDERQQDTRLPAKRTPFAAGLPRILADAAALKILAESDGAMIGYGLGFDHSNVYANRRVTEIEQLMLAMTRRRVAISTPEH